jgi:hypothetical protein
VSGGAWGESLKSRMRVGLEGRACSGPEIRTEYWGCMSQRSWHYSLRSHYKSHPPELDSRGSYQHRKEPVCTFEDALWHGSVPPRRQAAITTLQLCGNSVKADGSPSPSSSTSHPVHQEREKKYAHDRGTHLVGRRSWTYMRQSKAGGRCADLPTSLCRGWCWSAFCPRRLGHRPDRTSNRGTSSC